MTRDEVIAMTDAELRIKAGPLAGWHFHVIRYEETRPASRGWTRSISCDSINDLCDLPDYLHDISAAMELAEIAYSYGGLLFDVGRVHDDPTKWHADFFLLNPVCPGNEPFNELSPFYRMLGGSPEKAITRAFVMAMTSKESDEGELVTDTG